MAHAVKLTKGILNIGALTTEAIGAPPPTAAAADLNLNAWTTTLAGGTIRSRAGANTWNGPTTLTANSGLMTRGASDVSLTFSPTATINLDAFTLTCSSDLSSGGIKLQGNITGTGKIATGNFSGGGSINAGGTTVLSGSNDYSGGTDVNYGSLVFLKAASKPATGNVNVAAEATLGLGVGDSPDYFTATEIGALFAGTWSGATLARHFQCRPRHHRRRFQLRRNYHQLRHLRPEQTRLRTNSPSPAATPTPDPPTSSAARSPFPAAAPSAPARSLSTAAPSISAGQSINIGALSVVLPAASGETITAGSLTTSGTAANSYAVSNASGNAIIAASLLANGSAGLTKTGAGTVTLSGANTYTGGTTVSAGSITFLKTAALPATGTVTGRRRSHRRPRSRHFSHLLHRH